MTTPVTARTLFRNLRIGQSFDWVNPNGYNSFYQRCTKTSTRGYRDDNGQTYTVGSINASVYHAEEVDHA